MKKLALALLPAFALAACGEEPAPAPQPTPTETAVAVPEEPALPAPDAAVFAETLAKACPAAKPVSTSACKRAGFGSENVICQYGLGKDEYLRHSATLTPGDGEWTVAEPETVCAQGA
ncbi:hypothetical protein [Altererythrobacter litoralis]|uniref:Lipoprotein n=1 Tax=Altererythrobacter litoralis TaxID=3113904 RepID=A0ABU7GEH6_9SPHN|nr:hypothetical protein [Erythrobacteraceae bacterium 1XM1-14]